MNELAIVLIVVVVPVITSICLYTYTSKSSVMSLCYEVEQDDNIEIVFEPRNSPMIATI